MLTMPVVVRPRPIWQLNTRAAPGGGSQQRCTSRRGIASMKQEATTCMSKAQAAEELPQLVSNVSRQEASFLKSSCG